MFSYFAGLGRFASTASRQTVKRSQQSFKPSVEILEDRVVLDNVTYTWNPAVTGNWSDAGNWLVSVPGNPEVIQKAATAPGQNKNDTYSVNFIGSAQTSTDNILGLQVASFGVWNTFTGTINFAQPLVTQGGYIDGGNFSGNLTINTVGTKNTFGLTAGTFTGSTLTVATGSNVLIHPPNNAPINFKGNSNLVNNGSATWSSGNIMLDHSNFTNNSTLSISGRIETISSSVKSQQDQMASVVTNGSTGTINIGANNNLVVFPSFVNQNALSIGRNSGVILFGGGKLGGNISLGGGDAVLDLWASTRLPDQNQQVFFDYAVQPGVTFTGGGSLVLDGFYLSAKSNTVSEPNLTIAMGASLALPATIPLIATYAKIQGGGSITLGAQNNSIAGTAIFGTTINVNYAQLTLDGSRTSKVPRVYLLGGATIIANGGTLTVSNATVYLGNNAGIELNLRRLPLATLPDLINYPSELVFQGTASILTLLGSPKGITGNGSFAVNQALAPVEIQVPTLMIDAPGNSPWRGNFDLGSPPNVQRIREGRQSSLNFSNSSVLVNNNTYTNTGSATSSGDMTLNIAFINEGFFTIEPATTDPTLNLLDGFTQTSAGTLAMALGSVLNDIASPGPISLAGSLLLETVPGFTPSPGEVFTLIHNTSGSAISGQFTDLNEGDTVTVAGVDYKISYEGGDDGQDVTLTEEYTTDSSGLPVANDVTSTTSLNQTLTDTAGAYPTYGLLNNAGTTSGNPLAVLEVNGSTSAVGNAITTANGGTLTVLANGSVTYVPASNFVGNDTFTYTVSDGTNTATATVTLQVTDTVAYDAEYSTTHDQTLATSDDTPGLLANTGDASGNALSIAAINGSTSAVGNTITTANGGSLTVQSDGNFSYVPASGYVGDDSFTYTVDDGISQATATVTLHVVNSAPVASNAVYTTPYNQTLSLSADPYGLADNASDADGDTLTITAINGSSANVGTPITTAKGGTLTVQSDGSFTYLPAPGYVGDDSFTYTVSDGIATSTATTTLQMTDVVAYDTSYATPHDQTLTVAANPSGLLTSGSDADGNPLSVTAINGSTTAIGASVATANGGSVTAQADGSFVFVPSTGFVGTDSFTYTVSDGSTSSTATVYLTVLGVAANDAQYATPHDTTLTVSSGSTSLLSNANDPGGNSLSIVAINGNSSAIGSAVTTAAGGTLTVQSNGSFVYVPATGYIGDDSFTYTVTEGISTSTANVVIHVTDTIANDIAYSTLHDQTLTVTATQSPYGLLANASDPDGLPLTLVAINGNTSAIGSAVASTSGGTVTVQSDGSFVYTPATGFVGDDSFTYTVGDGLSISTATVTIHVTDQTPIAPAITYNVLHDQTLTATANGSGGVYGVLQSTSDPDGDALTVVAVSDSTDSVGQTITLDSGATLQLNADGSFVYTSVANSAYTDSFAYTVSDGVLTSTGTATIYVTDLVLAPPPPPPPLMP